MTRLQRASSSSVMANPWYFVDTDSQTITAVDVVKATKHTVWVQQENGMVLQDGRSGPWWWYFHTYAAARAHLIETAQIELTEAQTQVHRRRAELRNMRALPKTYRSP